MVGAEVCGCDAVGDPSFRAVNPARGIHPEATVKH